jgi:hypothetical protein
LNVNELKQLWNNLDYLNAEANSILVEKHIVDANNQFFKDIVYYKELENLLPEEFNTHVSRLDSLYMNFTDLEKVFELGRIDSSLKVTGLQSFLPCPAAYAKLVSVIWSSFDDTDDELKKKIALLDNDITLLIEHMQLDLDPCYYNTDIDKLLAHYKRIENLWHIVKL